MQFSDFLLNWKNFAFCWLNLKFLLAEERLDYVMIDEIGGQSGSH